MKKATLTFLAAFALIFTLHAQITLIQQSFENDSLTGWNYSTNPTRFNVGTDIWDTLTSLNNVASMPTDSSFFWGVQDLANSNGGTATGDSATMSFDYYTIPASAMNVAITFDYDIYGFDTNDDVDYEVFENNVSKGVVSLVAGGTGGISASGTETILITAGTDSVSIKLYVTQNGGSDYAGFDNFKVVSNFFPPAPVTIPMYAIGTINADDVNGEPDSNGVECRLNGVVQGINTGGTSVTQFILLDITGGITVRKSGGFTPSYTVRQGDSIEVWGTVGHYNGLTQFNADSMNVLSQNGRVRNPTKVAKPTAATESMYIRIDSVEIIAGTWPTPGNSANITVLSPANDTITMRIDRNTEVDDSVTTAPVGMFDVIGYGGQFDFSAPKDDGYQILPQVKGDIIIPATCNDPSAMIATQASATSVRLVWTSLSGASNIEFGVTGFLQGTGTMVNSTTSPYIANSLITGNSYDFYYQDTCVGVGTSNWVGPVSVTLSASPKVSEIWRTSATNIMVAYTDMMDNASATSTARYKGIAGLLTVTLNAGQDTATLNYGTAFTNGVTQTLTVDSVLNQTNVSMDSIYTYEFVYNNTTPDIVISEIMYNDLSAADTLEYLEIHNAGAAPANVGGMAFTSGIDYTVPAGVIVPPGSYLVIAKDAVAHTMVFGNNLVAQWTSGGLSNAGETITIANSDGVVIDEVTYDDDNGWPTDPDGNGYSLVLCDPTSDNDLAASWGVEPTLFKTSGYYCSPGVTNTCRPPFVPSLYAISTIVTVDAAGVADSNGVKCSVRGLVSSNQFSESGASGPDMQFTVIEADNSAGVTAISFSDSAALGYSPTLGDSVQLYGTVSQFRGLLQFNMDSVKKLSAGHPMPPSLVIDTVAEVDESRILLINQVEVVDATQWPAVGADANVQVLNMNGDTIIMRVDRHTNILDQWSMAPMGKFNLTGVGGQYSFNDLDGYQILPRFSSDIDTTQTVAPCAPPMELTSSDTTKEGVTVSWQSPDNNFTVGWAKGHMSTMPTDSATGVTTTSYTITGLDTNTHYHAWVKTVCTDGTSMWVGPVMFVTLEDAVGIEEIVSKKALIAFPNPNSTGLVRLNKVTDVIIRNLLGASVITKNNTNEIEIDKLSRGMYLLETAEGETLKLIVE